MSCAKRFCTAILTLSGLAALGVAAPASVSGLRCEYKADPIGIDVLQPRFSWQLESAGRGVVQTAYQIQTAGSPDGFDSKQALIWDTGRVDSDQSIHVVYQGPPVGSSTRYFWRVRVWDGGGQASGWSEPAFWEMGLLAPDEWTAKWITPDLNEDKSKSQPSPMLRREFQVNGKIRSARLYATSLGLYEVRLNGERVGDQLLTPGWTSYDTRLQYQTYDVTNLISAGGNAIGVLLGDGWYRGYIGWADQPKRSTATRWRCCFNCKSPTKMAASRQSAATKAGRPPPARSGWPTSTWARPTTPGSKSLAGRQRATTIADGPAVRTLDHGKEILIAPAGPPVRRYRGNPAREDHSHAAGGHGVRHGPEHGRLGRA